MQDTILPIILVVTILFFAGRYSWYMDNIIFAEQEDDPDIVRKKPSIENILNNVDDSRKWKAYAINLKTQIIHANYSVNKISKSDQEIAKEALDSISTEFPKFCEEPKEIMSNEQK